jgi:hypothetical protein
MFACAEINQQRDKISTACESVSRLPQVLLLIIISLSTTINQIMSRGLYIIMAVSFVLASMVWSLIQPAPDIAAYGTDNVCGFFR